jgi:hypothetical protein
VSLLERTGPETAAAPTTGRLRLARVLVLGGTSLALASAAHLLGGGRLPEPGVLAVVALLLGLAAVAVTGRRCRTATLVVLLAVEQGLLHLVLDAAATAGFRCGPEPDRLVAHADPMSHLAACAAPVGEMVGHAPAAPGWSMWLAHGVAVLATAALLARGEAWLWRVLDRVRDAAAPAGPRPLPEERRVVVAVAPRPAAWLRRHAPAAPRGPPPLGSFPVLRRPRLLPP